MNALIRAVFWPALLLLQSQAAYAWSTYVELGAGLGKLSNVDSFFGTSGAGNSNMGFCGGLSFYVPVTSPKNIFHFELGIQNRMYFVSTSSQDLAMISSNIAARFEFYRFYVGAGYSPIHFASTAGPLSLSVKPGASSFFGEGGLIWRVVPELQIVLSYAMEYGISPKSPSPGSEYGLRFRFPLSPYSSVGDASSKFDGFRYPFGIMK